MRSLSLAVAVATALLAVAPAQASVATRCAAVVHLDDGRAAFVERDLCTGESRTLHRVADGAEVTDWTVLGGRHLLYVLAVDETTARVVVWRADRNEIEAWPDIELGPVVLEKDWLTAPLVEDGVSLEIGDDRGVRLVAQGHLDMDTIDWQAIEDDEVAARLTEYELLGRGWTTREITAPDELGVALQRLDETLVPLAERAAACTRDDVQIDEGHPEHDRIVARRPAVADDDARPTEQVLAVAPARDTVDFDFFAFDLQAPCTPHVTVTAAYERGSMCWAGTVAVFDPDFETLLEVEASTCERNHPRLPWTDGRYLVQRDVADGWVIDLETGQVVHRGARDFTFIPGT